MVKASRRRHRSGRADGTSVGGRSVVARRHEPHHRQLVRASVEAVEAEGVDGTVEGDVEVVVVQLAVRGVRQDQRGQDHVLVKRQHGVEQRAIGGRAGHGAGATDAEGVVVGEPRGG